MNDSHSGHEQNTLISNPKEVYGERFQEHLLEQYKLYVDSSQRVSEKRITTGNYLLTVSSSLVTLFGIAAMLHAAEPWLLVIPVAGLLVSYAWFSVVVSYKNLNAAKFKVIHELEDYLPAALFRYEWHCCELGTGKAYKPVTRHERWVPAIFGLVYLALAGYVLLAGHRGTKGMAQRAPVNTTFALGRQSQGKAPAHKSRAKPKPVPPERHTAGRR